MLTRPPINGLQPRTEREAARDRFDWWEPSVSRSDRRRGRALAILIGAVLALLLVYGPRGLGA